jgi:hypothetical protein
MKYILMMNGKRSDFEGYAKRSKEDLRANVAFIAHIQQRTIQQRTKDSGVFVSTEGLGWPSEAKHATECDPIDRAGLDAETNDPSRVLIHDHQDPVGPQGYHIFENSSGHGCLYRPRQCGCQRNERRLATGGDTGLPARCRSPWAKTRNEIIRVGVLQFFIAARFVNLAVSLPQYQFASHHREVR